MRNVLGFFGGTAAALISAGSVAVVACTVTPVTSVLDAGSVDSGAEAGSDAGLTAFTAFKPSNLPNVAAPADHLGAVVIRDASCHVDGDLGTIGCSTGAPDLVDANYAFQKILQPSGSTIGVFMAQSFRVEQGANVIVDGPNAIAFVAFDKLELFGSIVAAGKGETRGAGGFEGTAINTMGGGPGGGHAASTANAAGGGSFCGIGGAGAAIGGGADGGTPGAGGTAYGTPDLVPLSGGSSGGGGTVGTGGAGGGAVELVAGTTLTIAATGLIHVGGGGGNFGGVPEDQCAAGGGSGGAILLESLVVTVAGTLASNGGGGGQGNLGDTGQDATGDTQPALGGSNAAKASFGGSGSAAGSAIGAPGNDTAGQSAGAGGGGAGRIRINTTMGTATLAGAKLSPDATTTCVTQGSVKK